MTKLEKWVKWQEIITKDMIRLHGSRQIYNDYVAIIMKNKSIEQEGILFHNWIVDNYVTFVAMTIRRQADYKHDDVISLAKLILDITENHTELTREWYLTLPRNTSDFWKAQADDTFTRNAGNGDYFDAAIGIADFEKLMSVSDKLSQLATLSIAHHSKKTKPSLTFDEVNACIDTFRELVQKYILLLTFSSNAIEPVMDYWQGIFTKAWIKQERP